jgi:Ca2+/Na+ antiporter
MTFDRSAKIYTGVLFVVTTIFTIIAFTGRLGQLAGVLSLVAFVIYITSIGYGIYKGVLDAPEDDSDGSDDSDEEEIQRSRPSEASPLLANDHMSSSSTEELTQGIPASPSSTKRQHSLLYHIGRLLLGFIALSLSGYVLSHAASSLATALYLSDTVVGITILSFATTLPEKLLSVLSGMRGHGGIVVASTAGSNIFLLTLCLGVIFVADGGKKHLVENILGFEIWSAWACSVLLMAIVWTGGNRVVGGLMLMLYIAFIVLEFTMFRR